MKRSKKPSRAIAIAIRRSNTKRFAYLSTTAFFAIILLVAAFA